MVSQVAVTAVANNLRAEDTTFMAGIAKKISDAAGEDSGKAISEAILEAMCRGYEIGIDSCNQKILKMVEV